MIAEIITPIIKLHYNNGSTKIISTLVNDLVQKSTKQTN